MQARQEPWYAAYAARNLILKSLGYKCYKDYLESEIWREIRQKVLASNRQECQACGMRATCVHHYHYSKANLSGKNTEGLISLCHPCHTRIEFAENQKLSARQANTILNTMMANYRKRLANKRDAAAERQARQAVTKAVDKSNSVVTVHERPSNPYCPLCGQNPTCKHPKQGVPIPPPLFRKKKRRRRR